MMFIYSPVLDERPSRTAGPLPLVGVGAIAAHNPPWAGRRKVDALKRVKALGRRVNAPCVICQLSINYDLEYPHPDSCSVQHVKPQSLFPNLRWDPSNWKPSHLSCNQGLGARTDDDGPGLGLTSGSW